jgi:hypothetical protein
MTKMKWTGIVLIAGLTALGSGWLWGAWGRWAAEGQAQSARLLVCLAEARAGLLSARVDVYELNFGKASADIEQAKAALGLAADLLDGAGRTDAAAAARTARLRATEAQQLSGSVDQSANAKLAEALSALARASADPGKK